MSGSIAAIAAYDGSGTQGYGTTDKSVPDAKSIFWNENDKNVYYVNGSSFSEVSSNKGEITTPETIVFTFDNDSDAINDLTLAIERTGQFTKDTNTPVYYMLYFIDRIEICMGNQVICTQNTMQLIKDYFDHGDYTVFTNFYPISGSTTSTQTAAQTVNLNIFKMLSHKALDSSYLMACANNQSLQVKVYPQNLTLSAFTAYVNSAANVAPTAFANNTFSFKLFANKISMTNAERDFLIKQVVPKRTNISQFAQLSDKPIQSTINVGDTITINCDHFNIYADKLCVLGVCHKQLENLGGFDVELFLNSTSYSGELPYYIAQSQSNTRALAAADTPAAIANDASGTVISAAIASINTRIHELNSDRFFYYKIDLAKNGDSPYDQNYVPLARFDSIRLVLTAKKAITKADDEDFFETLTVVAEGKCTALYEKGAVTFNNY